MATAAAAAGGEHHSVIQMHSDDDQHAVDDDKKEAEWLEKMMAAERELNRIVLCVASLEWAGNAAGTVALLWATVVLLGGFCSNLNILDFWFATIMIFIEATRVFIRNDALISQWLFGSTRAFRWEDSSLGSMLGSSQRGNLIAMAIGVGINLVPAFQPEIIVGILKMALLVIISQLHSRRREIRDYYQLSSLSKMIKSKFGTVVLILHLVYCPALLGTVIYVSITVARHERKMLMLPTSALRSWGLVTAWVIGTMILAGLTIHLRKKIFEKLHGKVDNKLSSPPAVFTVKVIAALGLLCSPFIETAISSSCYRYISSTVAVIIVLSFGTQKNDPDQTSPGRQHAGQGAILAPGQPNQSAAGGTAGPDSVSRDIIETDPNTSAETSRPSSVGNINKELKKKSWHWGWGLSCQIVDTLLPILFIWSLTFPLRGIPLEDSFYILFPALLAALVGNMQIPTAFVQIVLSWQRIRGLLLGSDHLHHHDYHPLPQNTSPNMVPAIVIFFVLELCQGSSYMVATILGLFSVPYRRSLASASGFPALWGVQAVKFYYYQAYRTRSEKGLFPSEKYMPSLASFAVKSLSSIEPLGRTRAAKTQLVGVRIIHSFLQRSNDSVFRKKLVIDIDKNAPEIVTKITGLIFSHCANRKNRDEAATDREKKDKEEKKEAICLSLQLVRDLASTGGEIGATFRQGLCKNNFLLFSVQSILDLKDSQPELQKLAVDIIAKLAWDKDGRQAIGRTKGIIGKLMHIFLPPESSADTTRENNNNNNNNNNVDPHYSLLRKAAGEALANLTITNEDNCWAILEERGYDNLVKDLIDMRENNEYSYGAANLLYNLCADDHSRHKLIIALPGAKLQLESAMPDVMKCIKTNEGEQLEAVLSITSQIGYLIPQHFAKVLESDTYRAEFVKKLLDMEPCRNYPRMRRLLVEMVISIIKNVKLCPACINSFIEQGVMDALETVKRTPSRLEKYRVFLGDEGVVAENLPLGKLVDEAINLIKQATSTQEAQPTQTQKAQEPHA